MKRKTEPTPERNPKNAPVPEQKNPSKQEPAQEMSKPPAIPQPVMPDLSLPEKKTYTVSLTELPEAERSKSIFSVLKLQAAPAKSEKKDSHS